MTLNLHVTPVAGDVTVSNVSTPEDTAVKFLQGVALTDTDGSESITGIVVKSVPTGWVLKDDAGTVVFTGNGVATYTMPAGDSCQWQFPQLHDDPASAQQRQCDDLAGSDDDRHPDGEWRRQSRVPDGRPAVKPSR